MPDERKVLPKILIIDDNKQNIELLLNLFKDQYRTVPATSAKRAMKIVFSDNPPDIILSDIMMPDMDGYQFCTELKNHDATKNIPVIFVTAISEVMDATKGFEVGAVDYITKPFHPPMIQARVDLHLNYQRKQKLLEEYAFIDALTEIPNRRRFDQIFKDELHRARRSNQALSLLFMDIDFFKPYNDNYGHGKGDITLRQVAQTLKDGLKRAGDFVARYGGEEFVALLPYADEDEAHGVASQLQKSIAQLNIPHEYSEAASHITLSFGLISIPLGEDMSQEFIIEIADRALYEAKKTGRNCICRGQIPQES